MATGFDRKDRQGQPVEFTVRSEAQPVADEARVAVIVAHGMGQQVPFQTLGEFVDGTRKTAAAPDSKVQATTQFVDVAGGKPTRLSRLETSLLLNGAPTRVDFYEVYWAPHTQGVATLRDVITFLLRAGLGRWRPGKPFERWVDGDFRRFPVPFRIQLYLWLALLVVVGLVALNTVIAAGLARVIAGALRPDVPTALMWALLAGLSWLVRRLLVQYIGDVAVYVEAQSLDRFGQARTAIREGAASLARNVFNQSQYQHIAMVGHSLGSVVAYDTLNQLLLERPDRRDKTRLLFTFGSPLDKTAYLFGSQVKDNAARELLAASLQPLIRCVATRPRWVNVYSPRDIIGGKLDYYQDPATPTNSPTAVQNRIDPHATTFLKAHVQHWQSPFLYQTFIDELQATLRPPG